MEIIELEKTEHSVKLIRKPFGKIINKQFTDILFQDYLENPSAFILKDGDQVIGYLEIERESWHKRLRITNLLIMPDYRCQGFGSVLMQLAKKIGLEEGLRELILETQSCNIKAIDFYLKHGFTVVGIDLSAILIKMSNQKKCAWKWVALCKARLIWQK